MTAAAGRAETDQTESIGRRTTQTVPNAQSHDEETGEETGGVRSSRDGRGQTNGTDRDRQGQTGTDRDGQGRTVGTPQLSLISWTRSLM